MRGRGSRTKTRRANEILGENAQTFVGLIMLTSCRCWCCCCSPWNRVFEYVCQTRFAVIWLALLMYVCVCVWVCGIFTIKPSSAKVKNVSHIRSSHLVQVMCVQSAKQLRHPLWFSATLQCRIKKSKKKKHPSDKKCSGLEIERRTGSRTKLMRLWPLIFEMLD